MKPRDSIATVVHYGGLQDTILKTENKREIIGRITRFNTPEIPLRLARPVIGGLDSLVFFL